jgi:hypothetical protein
MGQGCSTKNLKIFHQVLTITGAFFVKTAKIYENFLIMKNFQFHRNFKSIIFYIKFNSILIIGKVSIKIILLGH